MKKRRLNEFENRLAEGWSQWRGGEGWRRVRYRNGRTLSVWEVAGGGEWFVDEIQGVLDESIAEFGGRATERAVDYIIGQL